MNIRPDDPVFSRAGSEDRTNGDMPDGNYYEPPQCGMTLRTWLAGMALQGMLANPGPLDGMPAVHAVANADALIAELSREPKP